MAVVYSVPSGPDHKHSVAAQVIVSAGVGPTDGGQYGGSLVCSAPGSWPEPEHQLAAVCPSYVWSSTFELDSGSRC